MTTINSAESLTRAEWDIDGSGPMTRQQQKMLNACCGDLAAQLPWHGHRLHRDDYRHMIAGTIMGWRNFPGIHRGEGAPGFIMLGGSSLRLSREQARDAITCALHIGDHPDEQHINAKPVHWCDVVYLATGFNPRDMAA